MMLPDDISSSAPENNETDAEVDASHNCSGRSKTSSSSVCSEGLELVPRSNFLQCSRCLRTYREEFMNDHWKEFHPQVKCSFCQQSVDRFLMRKHQEQYCPERTRFCPRCYIQMPHSQLESHLKTCTSIQVCVSKEKVERNKGLSFKGTVFEQHTRIAKSFINIARGHQDEKPPYERVVKVEKGTRLSIPSVNDLVNAFCPSTYFNSGDRQVSQAISEDYRFLKHRIYKPLKIALLKHEQGKTKKCEKKNGHTETKAETKFSRIRPPKKARRVREIHQSLSHALREESGRRKFVKSWLQNYILAKEKKKEAKIKDEERTEDDIIDEAIELEMNKDSVSRISSEKWPYFVEDIKSRRNKWKDLGFNLEDCSSDDETRKILNKRFQQLHVNSEANSEQTPAKSDSVNDEPTGLPYWRLIEKNLEENKDKKGTDNSRNGVSGGFYKFCESCYQLFHEDYLAEHIAGCKIQEDESSIARQKIKDIWKPKPKKAKSLQGKLNANVSCPLLNIPRPFAAEETSSSLELNISSSGKYHRTGKNKYAFITKQGRY